MSPGRRDTDRGTRRALARRSLTSLALVLAATTAACERAGFSVEDNAAGGTAAAAGGAGGAASGSPGAAGGLVLMPGTAGTLTLPPPSPACQIPKSDVPVFAEHVVSNEAPARRELYTWTTAEQVAELRAGSVLMTRTEREGLGPGFAMEALAAVAGMTAITPGELDVKALAQLLIGPAFSKARYAWTDPWATRAGWPGESYGDQLVRLVLREDAFVARFRWGKLDVVDMNNAPVAIAEALAHPERLAGVYFVRDAGTGGPRCGGSFSGGDRGYREFIIGNEAMIEEWSLGTEEIRARLEADIARLQEFFDRVRVCPVRDDPVEWNLRVVCDWDAIPQQGELGAYEAALAIPSANYLPAPTPLANLIEALQSSLFEPDPFVVRPGQAP